MACCLLCPLVARSDQPPCIVDVPHKGLLLVNMGLARHLVVHWPRGWWPHGVLQVWQQSCVQLLERNDHGATRWVLGQGGQAEARTVCVPDVGQGPGHSHTTEVIPQFFRQLGCKATEGLQARANLGHSVALLRWKPAAPGWWLAHGLEGGLNTNCTWAPLACVVLLAQEQRCWGDPGCH